MKKNVTKFTLILLFIKTTISLLLRHKNWETNNNKLILITFYNANVRRMIELYHQKYENNFDWLQLENYCNCSIFMFKKLLFISKVRN